MKKRRDGKSYINGYHKSYLFNKKNLKKTGKNEYFWKKNDWKHF